MDESKDEYIRGKEKAEKEFSKKLNDSAYVKSFSKGYRQGYRDGYLEAINDIKARAIEIKEKMGDKTDADSVYPRPWWLPPWL